MRILEKYGEFERYAGAVKDSVSPVNVIGLSESQKAHLIFACAKKTKKPALAVSYSAIEAKKLYEDLSFFCGDNVFYFPGKEFVFYPVDTVSHQVSDQRLEVLSRLYQNDNAIVVTDIDALLSFTAPKEEFDRLSLTVKVSDVIDLKDLTRRLLILGYNSEDMVEGSGQFSVRGGIVDIFSPNSQNPVRIELFDEEVDSVRFFDVQTQKTIQKANSAFIIPCREFIYDTDKRKLLEDIIQKSIAGIDEKAREIAVADIERLRERHYFASNDKYVSVIYPKIPTVLDYMPKGSLFFIDEPKRTSERFKSLKWELAETVSSLLEKGVMFGKLAAPVLNWNDAVRKMTKNCLTGLLSIGGSCPDYRAKEQFSFAAKTLNSFHGNLEFLYEDLRTWHKRHATVVILSGSKSRGISLADDLNNQGIECVYIHNLEDIKEGKITVTNGRVNKGFEYPLINFVLISDTEMFGKKKGRRRAAKPTDANKIQSYTDITPGDYVVHQTHGIGQYIGIEKLVVDGITKDYLKISYKGTDNLYIPVNQLDLLYKYIGNTGRQIRLSKLGGADWNKTKARVKASTAQLAEYLIGLYSERLSLKGHKFSFDTPWQREFEDTFDYVETDDQIRCIEEVKRDMESEKPMDRLLCGDVGYGKTEVALRAAFKAVSDSKQVAYLVPTTILALQHFNNFCQRMKNFPIKVEMLSRFRTAAQQKDIIKRIKTGEVDIVIGTHRLLQKDLEFRNLGLLIIDEEQRFGVSHKEKLKEIRKNVDVLTLTATPIPRTLHMAMVNIRDMSVIAEPPEERYPIQTYVLEHDDRIIADAINKELSRGGQVYYVFNRVQGIYSLASRIQRLIPDAKVGVGHGKMKENELEDIMIDVINQNINVLVCTTIIETGLDIPNVNTIIIENADHFGLSQLYQLRGRVGRSNRLAYAYFTYRRDKMLTEVAQKRLRAIREFTEFGSGFKIAMRDLEIRGAGNLLGAEQHGHMDAVGYDMYCRLLKESIDELQGKPKENSVNTSIDIPIDAHIPEKYIKNQDQRIDIYKKIAAINSIEDSYEVEEELEDRFSDPPRPVRNLIEIALIKADAAKLGISEITCNKSGIFFYFDPEYIDTKLIGDIIAKYKNNMLFSAGSKPNILYRIKKGDEAGCILNIKFVLQDMKELKS